MSEDVFESDDIKEVPLLRLSSERTDSAAILGLQRDAHTLAEAFNRTLDIPCDVQKAVTGHGGTYAWIKFTGSKPAPDEVTDIFNETAPKLEDATGILIRQVTTHDHVMKLPFA